MSCDVCRGTNSSRCPVCGHHDELIECPECGGIGYALCTAIDIRTGEETDVTAATYIMLPDDIQEARAKGQHYYKGYAEECEICGGKGEVLEDQYGHYEKI